MRGTLFDGLWEADEETADLGLGVTLLNGFALNIGSSLLDEVNKIARESPFRHMVTPGGFEMSVAMTNCGRLGWITDKRGYRYDSVDPFTQLPWPEMPVVFQNLAQDAAAKAGFASFVPDACLVNRYEPKSRLALHQDKNEKDFSAPIVSVSLGLSARFLLGGDKRSDRTVSIPLTHGDVIVWGGSARLRYHGIAPLHQGVHPLTGCHRINLTFRRAGL